MHPGPQYAETKCNLLLTTSVLQMMTTILMTKSVPDCKEEDSPILRTLLIHMQHFMLVGLHHLLAYSPVGKSKSVRFLVGHILRYVYLFNELCEITYQLPFSKMAAKCTNLIREFLAKFHRFIILKNGAMSKSRPSKWSGF